MKTDPTPETLAARVLVRGIKLDLTPALHQAALDQAERLLRRDDRIVRIRLDLELDRTSGTEGPYLAKGRVEIRGPDLVASVQDTDAYKALDRLGDKLAELLRRQHQKRVNTRNDESDEATRAHHGKT